jgi:hypothetical protein
MRLPSLVAHAVEVDPLILADALRESELPRSKAQETEVDLPTRMAFSTEIELPNLIKLLELRALDRATWHAVESLPEICTAAPLIETLSLNLADDLNERLLPKEMKLRTDRLPSKLVKADTDISLLIMTFPPTLNWFAKTALSTIEILEPSQAQPSILKPEPDLEKSRSDIALPNEIKSDTVNLYPKHAELQAEMALPNLLALLREILLPRRLKSTTEKSDPILQ